MNQQEEIEFCKKRIIEQDEYLKDALDKGKAEEYINSAVAVKDRFEKQLKQLQYETQAR